MSYQQGYVLAYTVCTIVFGLAAYYLGYVQGQRREVMLQEGVELAGSDWTEVKWGKNGVAYIVIPEANGHVTVNDQ